MKLLLSPAKLMSTDKDDFILKSSTPKFINEAAFIQSFLKQKSTKELQKMMHISETLANENYQRNQVWNVKPSSKKSCQAIYAFTGEVYRGLDSKSLNENNLKYLQQNLLMLSGLYGFLKPSDKVMLYRLEMGSKFEFDQYKNLYAFWRENLTKYLNVKLKKNEFVLNLASDEYAKAIDRKKIISPVIDVEFKDLKNGKLTAIMVFFKQARGKMARFCAENNIETLADVKAFDCDGYRYQQELSTSNKLVFTR